MTMLHTLNLRHLRAALAIVERGSVSAAAAEINLSQPAITQGIAGLEEALGQSLFERRPDGMAPTEAGTLLGRRMATAAEHLAQAMRSIRRSAAGGFVRPERLVTMAQLRAFVALAREGGFVSASYATGLSQPALHRAVRDLERLCGVVLVERRGRGVALTAAGGRLARGFRLVTYELETALGEIAALAGPDTGRITIGAMPLARAWLLPMAVGRFHRDFPDVRFDIAEGSHAELIEPLRDGELDMLVGALRDPDPGGDVVQEHLFTDGLMVIGRADHPLAALETVPVGDLADWPWLIARRGTPLRGQWERLFTDADLPVPDVRIECGSVMMLRGLMMEGDFLTLLSADQVSAEIRAGMLAAIGRPLADTMRAIGLTTRAGWQATESQRRFIAELKSLAATKLQEFE